MPRLQPGLQATHEVSMAGKDIVSAINELLQDLRSEDGAEETLYADKLIVMSGAFQQTAPIVEGGERNACVGKWLTYASCWNCDST